MYLFEDTWLSEYLGIFFGLPLHSQIREVLKQCHILGEEKHWGLPGPLVSCFPEASDLWIILISHIYSFLLNCSTVKSSLLMVLLGFSLRVCFIPADMKVGGTT